LFSWGLERIVITGLNREKLGSRGPQVEGWISAAALELTDSDLREIVIRFKQELAGTTDK